MNSTTMQEVRFLILFAQTSGKENCRRAIYSTTLTLWTCKSAPFKLNNIAN